MNSKAIFEQGKQSIKIPIHIYIRVSASVVGTKEGTGPLGDLLSQSIASSFGLGGFHIPLLGMYGVCSTCGLSLSAADTIYQHMIDFGSKPGDYDKIITGDLGTVGQSIPGIAHGVELVCCR